MTSHALHLQHCFQRIWDVIKQNDSLVWNTDFEIQSIISVKLAEMPVTTVKISWNTQKFPGKIYFPILLHIEKFPEIKKLFAKFPEIRKFPENWHLWTCLEHWFWDTAYNIHQFNMNFFAFCCKNYLYLWNQTSQFDDVPIKQKDRCITHFSRTFNLQVARQTFPFCDHITCIHCLYFLFNIWVKPPPG